ncbi:MAG: FHA domain-containing protein [Proteobacteria bacterium]|nr:FHA domain-containing protein [Pseudomonadota bacterium]
MSEKGFYTDSPFKLKKGVCWGAVFGFPAGLLGFFLADQIIRYVPFIAESLFLANLVYSLRWLLIGLSIGMAMGKRDDSDLMMYRGLISGTIAGLLGGIAITVTSILLTNPFWSRGIGFVVFSTILTGSLYHFSTLGRKAWLKALNGKLEGTDFELSQEIHFLGTQSNDDINLKSYQDIRPTHAKLVRYHSGYSLIDNDPFWQTYVNFRNIKEQPLKNGDIVKLGRALFQFCTVE